MRRLAIVCGAPASEMLAPFDDEENYEVWVLGNRHNRYPRYDRVFEIHDDLTEHGDPNGYADLLVSLGVPLVVGSGFPVQDDPMVEVFPFEEARAIMGRTYLTSSTAYMVAYAIIHGYPHIRLYGVDMAVDDHEYFWQRACLEAWIGLAKGRGIDIDTHETSPVLRSDYVEGVGCGGKPDFSLPPFTQDQFQQMAAIHARSIRECSQQIEALQGKIQAHGGAQQAYERLAKVARAVEMGQKIQTITEQATVK